MAVAFVLGIGSACEIGVDSTATGFGSGDAGEDDAVEGDGEDGSESSSPSAAESTTTDASATDGGPSLASTGSNDDGSMTTSSMDDGGGSSEGGATTGSPAMCGNGIVEPLEACDGAALEGATCDNLGYEGGTLACAADCGSFDTSGCIQAECAGLNEPCVVDEDCCPPMFDPTLWGCFQKGGTDDYVCIVL